MRFGAPSVRGARLSESAAQVRQPPLRIERRLTERTRLRAERAASPTTHTPRDGQFFGRRYTTRAESGPVVFVGRAL
jgi:hypothetical protein